MGKNIKEAPEGRCGFFRGKKDNSKNLWITEQSFYNIGTIKRILSLSFKWNVEVLDNFKNTLMKLNNATLRFNLNETKLKQWTKICQILICPSKSKRKRTEAYIFTYLKINPPGPEINKYNWFEK